MFGFVRSYVLGWLMGPDEDEECDCEEFQAVKDDEQSTLDYRALAVEMWVPPARYCIRAGGIDYWVDNYKFGPGGMSVDIFWTQKIGGVEKAVSASIFETSFVIVDYETTVTSKVFDQIKETNIDFMREVKVQEDATEGTEKRCIPQNTSVASSYA